MRTLHLSQSITSLRNEKPQIKVAVKFFICTLLLLCGWIFLHVQTICITDLYDCVNSYTVIILYVLYAFVCFWHVPIAWWQPQGSMECIYVCMYVYMYVCLNFTKPIHFGSRDSSVGIATRYGLQGPGIQSRWGDDIFHTRPERPWGPPNLLYNGYRVFTGGKAAGAWRWPPHPRLVARLNKE